MGSDSASSPATDALAATDAATDADTGGGHSPGATRVALNGVAGRMGRQLLAAVIERSDCEIGAALEAPGSKAVGVDVTLLAPVVSDSGDKAGESIADPVLVSDRAEAIQEDFDVIIDFSVPAATLALLEVIRSAAEKSAAKNSDTAAANARAIVIGTTGFTADEKKHIEQAAATLPIVMASNYSVGVTLSLQLLETTAKALGDDYDVEVIEAHHRNKVDAPSGTALSMGEAVAKGLNRDLAECAVYGREGITGARTRTEIGFETIRAGDIIGEHTVLFAGEGERIEITHRATDRMTFARGAVRAATWVAGQAPGLYDMSDVLGLSRS